MVGTELTDLLDESLKQICTYMNSCETEKPIDCKFCTAYAGGKFEMKNIFHLTDFYCSALLCFLMHKKPTDASPPVFYALGKVELFILKATENTRIDFNSVLKNTFIKKNEERENLREEIYSISRKYLVDEKIHIYREVEFDSFLYKLIKTVYIKNRLDEVGNEILNVLFFVLYKRGEHHRFYKIFDMRITNIGYRLAFLLTLKKDSIKNEEEVREQYGSRVKTEEFISEKDFQFINKKLDLSGELTPWFEKKKKRIQWINTLITWNHQKGIEAVDISMINKSIVQGHYKEGLLLYLHMKNRAGAIILDGAECSICGLINTHEKFYFNNLLKIIENFEETRENVCCELTDKILHNLIKLNEEETTFFLNKLFGKIRKFIMNDGLICCAVRVFHKYSTIFNQKVGNIFEYAHILYKDWVSYKKGKFSYFFANEPTEVEQEILMNMLEFCDERDDIGELVNVCRDIRQFNIYIDEKIIKILKKQHEKRFCQCQLFKREVVDQKYSRGLVDHFIEIMSKV